MNKAFFRPQPLIMDIFNRQILPLRQFLWIVQLLLEWKSMVMNKNNSYFSLKRSQTLFQNNNKKSHLFIRQIIIKIWDRQHKNWI